MSIALCESRITTDPILQAIQEQAFLAAKEVTYLLSEGT